MQYLNVCFERDVDQFQQADNTLSDPEVEVLQKVSEGELGGDSKVEVKFVGTFNLPMRHRFHLGWQPDLQRRFLQIYY